MHDKQHLVIMNANVTEIQGNKEKHLKAYILYNTISIAGKCIVHDCVHTQMSL